MASKGSNRRQSPGTPGSPSFFVPSGALNDLLAHAGRLAQLMDTGHAGSSLRTYAEAIAAGLGMGMPGGGDVQDLLTQLKSAAETAIDNPTALEELDGETLAQYQREYLEHFPQPEDLPVDAATPASAGSGGCHR